LATGIPKNNTCGIERGATLNSYRNTVNWNQLPAGLLAPFPCNLRTFRKSVKEVVATKEPKWG
jgi:hypothetical protein